MSEPRGSDPRKTETVTEDSKDSYSFISVDDPSFTDRRWQEFCGLLEKLNEKYHSPFSRTPWSELRQRFLSFLESMPNYERFVMLAGDEMVGWADFEVRNAGTPQQTARFHCDLDYDRVPQPLVAALGRRLLTLMTDYKCSTVFLSAVDERISELARSWMANELSRVARYWLLRANANQEAIDRWLEELPTANPDLHLEIFDTMPEEHLDRFADLLNQFANDMPKERESEKPFYTTADELRRRWRWREQNNVQVLTATLLDRDGQAVAFSYCSTSLHDPSDSHQAMTGVERTYRGRDLSKWLKAALFLEVGNRFPWNRTMTTEMRAVNEPIQRVNKQMGYTLASQGAEFEIIFDGLRQSIAREPRAPDIAP